MEWDQSSLADLYRTLPSSGEQGKNFVGGLQWVAQGVAGNHHATGANGLLEKFLVNQEILDAVNMVVELDLETFGYEKITEPFKAQRWK